MFERKITPRVAGDRLSIAETLLQGSSLWHSTLLDLGAAQCKFATIAANMGMKVTAVDARTVRKPSKLHPNITFVHGNFLEMDFVPADYDLVFMFGILYHLTIGEKQRLLSKFAGRHVIIDTHYCADDDPNKVEEEGYEGVPYVEGPDMQTMLANPKASATCLRSFWFTEASLGRMLLRYFSHVEKVVPEHYKNRTFFICRGEA